MSYSPQDVLWTWTRSGNWPGFFMRTELQITGVDSTLRALERADDAYRTAAAITLTRVAQASRREVQGEIKSVFDNPTPFIRNSPFFQPASNRDRVPEALVGIRDARFSSGSYGAADVLSTYIDRPDSGVGGSRATKAMEVFLRARGVLPQSRFLAVGFDAPTDQYGNVKRSIIRKAFEQVTEQTDPYARKGRGGKRGLSKRGWRYFVAVTNGEPVGIFRSRGRDRKAENIFLFTRRPRYSQNIKFDELIERNNEREFNTNFIRRLTQQLDSRIPRTG